MHCALQLISTGELEAEIDASWSAMTGLHARIADVDAAIGQAHQDVFEDPHPVDHLDTELRREALPLGGNIWVPAHRQSPFAGNRLHIGAILTVHSDAMVAEGDSANDCFTRQGAAAAAEAVVRRMQRARLTPTAPVLTSVVQAYRVARGPPERAPLPGQELPYELRSTAMELETAALAVDGSLSAGPGELTDSTGTRCGARPTRRVRL